MLAYTKKPTYAEKLFVGAVHTLLLDPLNVDPIGFDFKQINTLFNAFPVLSISIPNKNGRYRDTIATKFFRLLIIRR